MIVKSENSGPHHRELERMITRLSGHAHTKRDLPLSLWWTTNWSPTSCGFGLRFNCYNLITKYVPEKALKDAFYNCHKADYTIQSEIPQRDDDTGGGSRSCGATFVGHSTWGWLVKINGARSVCQLSKSWLCFSGFFKVLAQANMLDSSSILLLPIRLKTMRAAFH